MLKLIALAVPAALLLAGCNQSIKPNEKTCSPSYIKEVADKEGLDKAKALSSACLEKGYDNALSSIDKAGAALKEKLFGEKN